MTWVSRALRALLGFKRHGRLALAAIGVLALGIGLDAAIFSVVYVAFFKPLDLPNSENLVYVYALYPSGKGPNASNGPSPVESAFYEGLRASPEPFASIGCHSALRARMTLPGVKREF